MDIQKQRIGGFPQGNIETTLNLGNSQILNQEPQKQFDMCLLHPKQPIIAFNMTTNKLVCKLCMFLKPSPGEPGFGQGPPKIIPTALITKTLKTQFDQTFLEYKQNLCDILELTESNNIQDLLRL